MTVEEVSVTEELDELRGLIEADRDQFDELCRLTPRVARALNHSTIMRELVPAEYGGRDGSMLAWFRTGVAISTMDGSAGWVTAQGAIQNCNVAMQCEADFARKYFSDPGAYPAACIQTDVVLRPAGPDMVELNGTWRVASGAPAATYLGGVVRIEPAPTEPVRGIPCVLVARDQVVQLDTWNPLGLRGSGSLDLRVEDVVVPANQVFYLLNAERAGIDHRLVPLGSGSYLVPPTVAAVQLGIARHALDLSLGVLANKSQLPALDAPLLAEATVARDLGWAEAKWRLAMNGMQRAVSDVDEALGAGPLETRSAKIAMRACSIATAHMAAEITRTAFDLTGTDGSTRGSQLERCFRDAHTLTSHISVRTRSFGGVGRLLTGMETPADTVGL